MSTVSIVFHSGFGHTKALAEAIKRGAESVAGTLVHLISVEEVTDATWATFDASDAILFGSPTYMGSVSGPFKTFMDATSKAWFERRWVDKLAGGFTVSGSPSGDKLNTLQTLSILAAQQGMLWLGVLETPYNEQGLNRLGASLGVMAQAGQVPPEQEPGPADLATGESYGRRVALAAARWARGAA